ncbi:trigger factor-related chaperone [Mycoplasma sp. Ms02]|uniref:trigger factor-related chaperone n=1 Tax=Mycoplasma sp. Ms02 TaxID=353851 RepID=UPI001C89523B|nr:hypothetical protein [Mycoplasma sp. Ms02]QZE12130.1 hypothetical protein K4L35_02150 [Mycoplasma sp. Ms02]
MKFYDFDYKLEKNEWITFQNQALEFIKSQTETFKQEDILRVAKEAVVNSKVAKEFNERFASDKTKVVFHPVLENYSADLDSCELTLRFYYQDDVDKINLSLDSDVEFKDTIESDQQIEQFINNFMSMYAFKMPTNKPIKQNGNSVVFEIQNERASKPSQQEVEMNGDAHLSELTLALVDKKAGDEFETDFGGEKHRIKILEVNESVRMPITDQNAVLTGIKEITNRETAYNFIKKTVIGAAFQNLLINYKQAIYEKLSQNITIEEMPEQLYQKQYEAYREEVTQNAANDPRVSKEDVEKFFESQDLVIKKTIQEKFKQTFLNSFVPRKLNISPTDEEIKKEYKLALSHLPVNERYRANISVARVVEVLINKKVALLYLEHNHKEIFDKYKDYVQ